MRSYSAGGKLPGSTGDKLLTGEIDSTLLGRLFETTGEVTPLMCLYSVGEQSYIKTAGDACLGMICILRWGILRFLGDAQFP